jgi:hypothetical protein
MSIPKPTEQDIVKACLQLLALRGVPAWRNNTGGRPWTDAAGKPRLMRFGLPGSSDILGVVPALAGGRRGMFLAVEVKRPGGKLRPEQAAFLDRVRAAGGLALCVTSDAELDAALRAEGVA